MKFNATATFLGSDVATSAKGNVYQKACLMVGSDTITLLCEDKNVTNIKKFSECLVEIDYNPTYKNLKIVSIA